MASPVSKPVPPLNKPMRKPRVKRLTVVHGPSRSVYTFTGQPPLAAEVGAYHPPLLVKLAQAGLDAAFRGKTHKQASDIIYSLEAGRWFKAEPAPKLPDPLAEAMANIAKRRGKGLLSDKDFADHCNPAVWQTKLFGHDGKGGWSKAQRQEVRGEEEVQMEIAAVKLARRKAAPVKDAAPSALDKALA